MPPPDGCPCCGVPFDYTKPGGGHDDCWVYFRLDSNLKWLRKFYKTNQILSEIAVAIGRRMAELHKEWKVEHLPEAQRVEQEFLALKESILKLANR